MLLFFANDFRPLTGGIAEYIHQLCRHLHRERVVITTVPGNFGADKTERYPIIRVNWDMRPYWQQSSLNKVPFFRRANFLWWRVVTILKIQRILNDLIKNHANILIIISSWCLIAHWLCSVCREKNIPYVIMAHGSELKYKLPKKLEPSRATDFQSAKMVIVNSSFTKDIVESIGVSASRVFLVHPGISRSDYPKVSSDEIVNLDRRFGIVSKKIMLSICRLVSRKGIDLSLRAFAEIHKDFPDYVYVIAGDGPEQDRLQQLANDLDIDDHVVFTGNVDHSTKCALYQRCNLFIMPNRNSNGKHVEGFGIVFLEAAMYAKSVIGGRNGGVIDAVLHDITGLLVDTSNDYTDTLHALRTLLTSATLRKQMGYAAKERALKYFSWDILATKFEKVLSDNMV